MLGVALSGTNGALMGEYVHNETPEWVLTSDLPLDFSRSCEDDSVYENVLPGRLGMFVYPSDVRFHMKGLPHTSRNDLDAAMCAERLLLHREMTVKMHHLTVVTDHTALDTFIPNHEAHCETEDDEDDDEEYVDDEDDGVTGVALDECIESDDEVDV